MLPWCRRTPTNCCQSADFCGQLSGVVHSLTVTNSNPGHAAQYRTLDRRYAEFSQRARPVLIRSRPYEIAAGRTLDFGLSAISSIVDSIPSSDRTFQPITEVHRLDYLRAGLVPSHVPPWPPCASRDMSAALQALEAASSDHRAVPTGLPSAVWSCRERPAHRQSASDRSASSRRLMPEPQSSVELSTPSCSRSMRRMAQPCGLTRLFVKDRRHCLQGGLHCSANRECRVDQASASTGLVRRGR